MRLGPGVIEIGVGAGTGGWLAPGIGRAGIEIG